jgi:multicomponent K+:H+ antiporter subunit E
MTPPRQLDARAKPESHSWVAHIALSLLLAAVWLLLRQSVALVDLIWAVVLGLVVPRLVFGFIGPAAGPRGLARIVRFAGIVLWDIVVSNITVARIVLNPWSKPRPAWVPVHLDTHHPTAVTLLATVITTTPGTVSCVVDDEKWVIHVHALDCDDPAEMAAQIKQRYERPLREIFE